MAIGSSVVEDGVASADEQRQSLLAALGRERDGLVARGNGKRVKEVEAEMAKLVDEVVPAEHEGEAIDVNAEPEEAEQAIAEAEEVEQAVKAPAKKSRSKS